MADRPPPVLILSGAYVGAEMIAEFGKIPPSFLPLGTRRLFELQLNACAGRQIWLTVPEDYEIADADADVLSAHGVTVVRCDASLPLCAALAEVLGAVDAKGAVIVLHGDTVARIGHDAPDDFFATATTGHHAVWAEYSVGPGGALRFDERLGDGARARTIACGLFGFSDAERLRDCAQQTGRFDELLTLYASDRPFEPVAADGWLDFGHLHTYYQSRQTLLDGRSFNSLVVKDGAVTKSGEDVKISAESRWYEALPPVFRPFAPQLVFPKEDGKSSYAVEYLLLPSLAELFCFAELPPHIWSSILGACGRFIALAQGERPPPGHATENLARRFFDDIYRDKTHERLARFARDKGLDLGRGWTVAGRAAPSLGALADTLLRNIRPTRSEDLTFWHGDFHFANILYDFRAQRIRCVDPRGMLSDGEPILFGDRRYDVAKLCHSVVGLYDLLTAGHYTLSAAPYDLALAIKVNKRQRAVQELAADLRMGALRLYDPEILRMTALLFLAMAPLHSEDEKRQFAMLANAYRIAGLAEKAR